MKFTWLLAALLAGAPLAGAPLAQAAEPETTGGNAERHEALRRHRLGGTFGYTYVREAVEIGESESEKGIWVPTLGVLYSYRLDERWSVGGAVEQEFSDYLIVDKDLRRDRATVVTALLFYEVLPAWEIYTGGGLEIETDETLGVFRLGTGYEFELGEAGWYLGPDLTYDFKEEYDTWTVSVSGGKRL